MENGNHGTVQDLDQCFVFCFFNEYGENWLESAAAHCRQVMISMGFYVEARWWPAWKSNKMQAEEISQPEFN